VVVDVLERKRFLIVGEQGAVVVEGGDEGSAVKEQCVAQALLDPCGAGTGSAAA
jgi:hypothetical protein